MAIIDMHTRRSQAKAVALRHEDRFMMGGDRLSQGSGPLGFLIGTAIVAGSVIGLLMYDAKRPIGFGTAPSPSLLIAVEPMTPGEAK